MSPHQHPAPARVGWGGGVGLDSSVNWVTVAGVGHGSRRALCGAACSFWPCARGVPILEAPTAGGEGSLASNICQGTSTPLTSAGARKHRPGVICSGHLVGCPSPWGPVCLGHSGGHSSKPMAMSDAPQCSAGTCQHCWDPAVV